MAVSYTHLDVYKRQERTVSTYDSSYLFYYAVRKKYCTSIKQKDSENIFEKKFYVNVSCGIHMMKIICLLYFV